MHDATTGGEKGVRKDQLVIVVQHEDFKTDDAIFIELYTVKHYWKVHENGDPELQFDVALTNDDGGEQEEEQSPLPAAAEEHLNSETENTIEAS